MISPTSNQKNVLKEYLERGLPHLSPICLEIITAYCTSFPTRIPYPLFKEAHRIFWELPPGKVGKNGKIVKQSGQKGNTCRFYAIKRVLRTEQTRTTLHHALCSLRRKAITPTAHFSTPMASYQARNPADQIFLEMKNLDPHKATYEFHIDHFKLLHPEVPTNLLERIIREQEPIVLQQKPWHRFHLMGLAADQAMIQGYGLQTVPCSDLLTLKGLCKTLLKGPLVISGHFGAAFYNVKQPIMFAETIGNKHLYHWPRHTSFKGSFGVTHTIVLIGIEIKPHKTRVYWIDPADPSDPHKPDTQRIFIDSFETIIASMTTLSGISLSGLSETAKQQVPGALYNPQFTMV